MRGVLAALLAAPLLVTAVGLPAHAEAPTGKVAGVVYLDLNKDRERQPNEPPAVGVEVGVNPTSGEAPPRGTSDKNGNYLVADVPQGKASVQVVIPEGHESTTPWAVGVLVSPGETTNVDFGIAPE